MEEEEIEINIFIITATLFLLSTILLIFIFGIFGIIICSNFSSNNHLCYMSETVLNHTIQLSDNI